MTLTDKGKYLPVTATRPVNSNLKGALEGRVTPESTGLPRLSVTQLTSPPPRTPVAAPHQAAAGPGEPVLPRL